MKRIMRFAKPYIGMIILALVLLFVQAQCDLNLPNYMSNIVNVGLAGGGIEEQAPEIISEKGLELVSYFTDSAGKDVLAKSYLPKTSAGEVTETYPLAGEVGYSVLPKNFDDTALADTYNRAVYAMSQFMQQSGAKADAGETAKSESSMDVSAMYPMLEQFKSMPESAFAGVIELSKQVDISTCKQVGVVFTKAFYSELGADVDAMQNSYIWKIGFLMLLISLLGAAASIVVGYISAKTAAAMARDIRLAVFKKVEGFSGQEFDHFSTSSLITRTTNDVTQVQMLVLMGLRMIVYAPIMGIGGSVMAIQKGPSISWVILLACTVLVCLIAVIFMVSRPKFKLQQKLIDRLNLVARENLTGVMTVRAFGNQDFEVERFAKANGDLTSTQLFVNRVMMLLMPIMMLVMNISSVGIIWVGSKQVDMAAMQVGDMMAFMQYAMQIIMSFLMISMTFIMVPRAAVSADRIAEVLDTEPSIVDPSVPKRFINSKVGEVEFRDVSFRFSGAAEPALEHISFTAKAGETTAFIGSTGSGKSTLINLVPRFYDATEGQVFVNGLDVKEVEQSVLHDQIGYVPQKGMLHSGTIASNLRYGKRSATDEEVEAAAKTAQAMEFISNPDVGFDKEIAQGGTNVSGGQKQRLSIARALVKKPPIYIFDDSFSALDFKTDSKLRAALGDYTGGATLLIVAQRVSTIMGAEQIIVLEDGVIVGKGTHRELLKNCQTYKEIASSQLSPEELNV